MISASYLHNYTYEIYVIFYNYAYVINIILERIFSLLCSILSDGLVISMAPKKDDCPICFYKISISTHSCLDTLNGPLANLLNRTHVSVHHRVVVVQWLVDQDRSGRRIDPEFLFFVPFNNFEGEVID